MRNIETLCESSHVDNMHAHHKTTTQDLSDGSTVLGDNMSAHQTSGDNNSNNLTTAITKQRVSIAVSAAETACEFTQTSLQVDSQSEDSPQEDSLVDFITIDYVSDSPVLD